MHRVLPRKNWNLLVCTTPVRFCETREIHRKDEKVQVWPDGGRYKRSGFGGLVMYSEAHGQSELIANAESQGLLRSLRSCKCT